MKDVASWVLHGHMGSPGFFFRLAFAVTDYPGTKTMLQKERVN